MITLRHDLSLAGIAVRWPAGLWSAEALHDCPPQARGPSQPGREVAAADGIRNVLTVTCYFGENKHSWVICRPRDPRHCFVRDSQSEQIST